MTYTYIDWSNPGTMENAVMTVLMRFSPQAPMSALEEARDALVSLAYDYGSWVGATEAESAGG